jgi:hypothetical protein
MKNILLILLSIVVANVVYAQVNEVNKNTPTAIVVDDKPKPATQPRRSIQQVVVMNIELVFEAGKVQNAKVLISKRLNSFAPKVFARQKGEWEVVINSAEPRKFYVDNPGWREAETDNDSEKAYEWVAESGKIQWPLVIPLYDKDGAIKAETITIRDVNSGAIILEAEM